MGVCVVTRHGEQRMRERVGLPKKAVRRAAARAISDGLSRAEAEGALRRYMDWLYHRGRGEMDNIRIYGNNVFMFAGLTLVTVLTVPCMHRKQAMRQQKKKREG